MNEVFTFLSYVQAVAQAVIGSYHTGGCPAGNFPADIGYGVRRLERCARWCIRPGEQRRGREQRRLTNEETDFFRFIPII